MSKDKSSQQPSLFLRADEVLALIGWRGEHPRLALMRLRRKGLPYTPRPIGRGFIYPRADALRWLMGRKRGDTR